MLPLAFSLIRFFRTLSLFILPKTFALAQVENPLEKFRFCKHNIYLLFTIHPKEKRPENPSVNSDSQTFSSCSPFPLVY